MSSGTKSSSERAAARGLGHKLRLEAANAAFRYRLPAAVMNLAVVIATLVWASFSVPFSALVPVCLLQVLSSASSVVLHTARSLYRPSQERLTALYLPVSNAIAVAIAASNGIAALVMFEHFDAGQRTLYLMILAGISGLQAIITSFARRIPEACLLLTLGPQLVWSALHGSGNDLVMTIASLVWIVAMFGIVRETRQLLHRSVRATFDREQTAQALSVKVRELEDSRRALEQASRARTRFFAAASHDMRQPLHALGILCDVLQNSPDQSDHPAIARQIAANLRSTEQLLSEVLELSRLDADLVSPRIEAVELADILVQLEHAWHGRLEAAGMVLEVEARDVWVRTDGGLLLRVLGNYLGNALNHAGGGRRIRLWARVHGETVRIGVEDEGEGIAPAFQERIFDEFVQGDLAASDPRGGLGLGLAIVQRIARLLGHGIGVDSPPGKGATFWIDVPVTQDRPAMIASPAADVPGRILVIEDDAATGQALTMLLASWGCDVAMAGGPEEALDAVREGEGPDVILADLRLARGTHGAEAVEAVRRHLGRAVPAIYVTGETPESAARLIGDKAAPVLFKPVAPAKLRASLAWVRQSSVPGS